MRQLLVSFAAAFVTCLSSVAADFQKLPRRSTFNAEKLTRDPFEPIDGARNSEPVWINLGSEEVDEAQLTRFFRVTAYSIDRLAIALINGTAVAEGESFTVQTRGGKLRLRLLKVKQNGVVLKSSGTIFNVPILR
jgi:hypothetical protein